MFELFLFKAQKKIKKSYIDILSWVALGLAILASCGYFMWSYEGEFSFYFPHIFSLISLLLNIAPYVLLVLYLKKFQNELKATIIVPIIFGLLGLLKMSGFLVTANLLFGIGIPPITYKYNFIYGGILTFIIDIAFIISCVLSTISALRGLKNKLPVLISTSIGVIGGLILLISEFSVIGDYVGTGEYITLIGTFADLISSILLYVALGFFGIKYKIPAILTISPEKEESKSGNMSPEQALRILKEKLELEMITEEEYQVQRAEIISKL